MRSQSAAVAGPMSAASLRMRPWSSRRNGDGWMACGRRRGVLAVPLDRMCTAIRSPLMKISTVRPVSRTSTSLRAKR